MDAAERFLSDHAFLIGTAFLGFAILYAASMVAGQVAGLACTIHELRDKRTDDDLPGSIEASLEKLSETVDSLHHLFGGRQWQRDELDEDLEGPTIQSLLSSIAESLKRMAPEPSSSRRSIRG